MPEIPFDMKAVREQFPLLAAQRAQENPLVYLDNAATTQKPRCMLDAMNDYYCCHNANPSRGTYQLAKSSTQLYEEARDTVARFIACDPREVVFTSGATEALNLVAYSYGMQVLKPGDEIVLALSEHHSNLVPWQIVAEQTGAHLTYIYPEENGLISTAAWQRSIGEKTRIVAVAHVSNVLGSITPLAAIATIAHRVGAVVVADCAQSVAHLPLNLKEAKVDFAAFSGHKMYGPMGIGVLFGKRDLLKKMPPLLRGGGIVDTVFQNRTDFIAAPQCFEAGTPPVAAAVGLGAAIDFIESIGWDAIRAHEQNLLNRLLAGMRALPDLEVYGEVSRGKAESFNAATSNFLCEQKDKNICYSGSKPSGEPPSSPSRCSVVSFNVEGVDAYDVAKALDQANIAIRAGAHCAEPLVRFLGVRSTCRASLALYNTEEEIDLLLEALQDMKRRVTFMILSTMH